MSQREDEKRGLGPWFTCDAASFSSDGTKPQACLACEPPLPHVEGHEVPDLEHDGGSDMQNVEAAASRGRRESRRKVFGLLINVAQCVPR